MGIGEWPSRGSITYEPYTFFCPRENKGPHLNVYPRGFRQVPEQGPWPLNKNNIFMFVGSNTFGWKVSDEQTIAAYLQEIGRKDYPRIQLYNFGRAAYYSTQERILFEKYSGRGAWLKMCYDNRILCESGE